LTPLSVSEDASVCPRRIGSFEGDLKAITQILGSGSVCGNESVVDSVLGIDGTGTRGFDGWIARNPSAFASSLWLWVKPLLILMLFDTSPATSFRRCGSGGCRSYSFCTICFTTLLQINVPSPEIAAGGAVQTLRLGVLQLSAQK
jgi:hypothetical protein